MNEIICFYLYTNNGGKLPFHNKKAAKIGKKIHGGKIKKEKYKILLDYRR